MDDIMMMMMIIIPMIMIMIFMGVQAREKVDVQASENRGVQASDRPGAKLADQVIYFTGAENSYASFSAVPTSSHLSIKAHGLCSEFLQLWWRSLGAQAAVRVAKGYGDDQKAQCHSAKQEPPQEGLRWMSDLEKVPRRGRFGIGLCLGACDSQRRCNLDVLKVGHLCNTLLHHLLLLPDICVKRGPSLQNAILVFSTQRLVTGTEQILVDIIKTNVMHHGILVFTGETKIEGIAGEHEDNGALQDSQNILLLSPSKMSLRRLKISPADMTVSLQLLSNLSSGRSLDAKALIWLRSRRVSLYLDCTVPSSSAVTKLFS